MLKQLSLVGAAHECSMARRERRVPDTAALQTLGIDATAFKRTYKRR